MKAASDDRRVPPERSRPQPGGNHRHACGARPIVVRREQPAEHGLHAEKLKVVPGHRLAHHEVDVVVHPHHRAHRRVRRHVREHVVLRAQIEVVRIRVRRMLTELGVTRVDVDELRWTNDRQRTEQDRVDDGEDCGVEADGDGQRHDGGDGESRIPAQAAEPVAGVADQVLQPPPTARVPHRFADGPDAAQPNVRTPARLARIHARAQVLLGLHLQVEPQLVLRLGVPRASGGRGSALAPTR